MKIAMNSTEKKINNYFRQTYKTMKLSSKKRGHSEPDFTENEFIKWCKYNDEFNRLFEYWIEHNCDTNLRPSIDRLSESEGYSLSNIRVITWSDNRAKQSLKRGVPVQQLSLDGVVIKSFLSRGLASGDTGIHSGNIRRALTKGTTAGGYRWRYSSDAQN